MAKAKTTDEVADVQEVDKNSNRPVNIRYETGPRIHETYEVPNSDMARDVHPGATIVSYADTNEPYQGPQGALTGQDPATAVAPPTSLTPHTHEVVEGKLRRKKGVNAEQAKTQENMLATDDGATAPAPVEGAPEIPAPTE